MKANQKAGLVNAMPPLLLNEKADEFFSICEKLEEEIKPMGIIEQMYVGEIADRFWDILRYRRYKTVIVNNAFLAALRRLLKQLLCRGEDDSYLDHERAVDELAYGWFDSKEAKAQVVKLLRQFQMDEGAIEAEAFRLCSEDLERLDRLLTAAELRRDRALRSIADYRDSLSKKLQRCADRILENDEIPRLIAAGKRPD
jgi:hypothetical protein